MFAAPHGLSQRTTSFIASQRQGIHRTPLRHLIALIIDVHVGVCPAISEANVTASCARRAVAMDNDRKTIVASNAPGSAAVKPRPLWLVRRSSRTVDPLRALLSEWLETPDAFPLHDVGQSAVSRQRKLQPLRVSAAAGRLAKQSSDQCSGRRRLFGHPRPRTLGGARRDRTDDLMLAKHALSQLSYGPFSAPYAISVAGDDAEGVASATARPVFIRHRTYPMSQQCEANARRRRAQHGGPGRT